MGGCNPPPCASGERPHIPMLTSRQCSVRGSNVTSPARLGGGGGLSAILGDVTVSAAAGPNSCDIVTV